jgi:hypothetical protein
MKLPVKINQREKKVLLIGALIAVIIILYQAVTWYSGVSGTLREHIDAKRTTLQKQINKISRKEILEGKNRILGAELKLLERGILPGNKPPVVAARIQSVLKNMASSLNIEITVEKALNPVDRGLYIGIPVEIGFNATTDNLKKMLYKIKTSRTVLTVSELKVMVRNIRNPVNVSATLIVSGFIRKQAE